LSYPEKPKLKKGDLMMSDQDRIKHPIRNFIHKNTISRSQGLMEHGHIAICDGKNVIQSMPNSGVTAIPVDTWTENFEYTVLRPNKELKKNLKERMLSLNEHIGKRYSFADATIGAARLAGVINKSDYSGKMKLNKATCSSIMNGPYPEIAEKINMRESEILPVDIMNSGLFRVIKSDRRSPK
jgi:hypothetical protein